MTAGSMTLGWEQSKFVHLLMLDQLIDKHSRLTKEDILVHQSMTDHQRAFNVFDFVKGRRFLVSFNIILWKPHVPLSVGAII